MTSQYRLPTASLCGDGQNVDRTMTSLLRR